MNPCTVLDQVLAGQGYPAAVPTTADAKRSCVSTKQGYGEIGVLLQGGQTIDENITDPSKASTGDVNGRRAIQIRNGLGGSGACDVKMEVKPNSRALVMVTLRTETTDEACRLVNDVATRVEVLLPKNV
jgi:hypothetical protein